MPGLTKSQFMDISEGQPAEIRAYEDAIIMVVDHGPNDFREVELRPRHIASIRSMYEDWWNSHWAEVHEDEA